MSAACEAMKANAKHAQTENSIHIISFGES